MSFYTRATASVLALLGLGSVTTVLAQPIVPQRPNFGSYNSFFRPGGGAYFFGGGLFGGGFGGGFAQNQMMMQQNMQLQQQLNFNNQSIANLQMFLANGVNPNFPITGRGATFDNLGHWYPQSRMGGGLGGGGFGGGPMMAPRGPMMGGFGGGMGPRTNTTAGNGMPINRPNVGPVGGGINPGIRP